MVSRKFPIVYTYDETAPVAIYMYVIKIREDSTDFVRLRAIKQKVAILQAIKVDRSAFSHNVGDTWHCVGRLASASRPDGEVWRGVGHCP